MKTIPTLRPLALALLCAVALPALSPAVRGQDQQAAASATPAAAPSASPSTAPAASPAAAPSATPTAKPAWPTPKPPPRKYPEWYDRFDRGTHTFTLPYRLLKPANIEPGKRYPLLVLLHGTGEIGTDNQLQLRNSLVDVLKNTDGKYPCFILVPQCPPGHKWVDFNKDERMSPEPTESLRAAMSVVDELVKELPIDPKRLYLTGISLGGFATWDWVSRDPGKFAAAVPVCGGADLTQAPRLTQTPIWAFHGDKDDIVPTRRTRDMIEAIRAAGGQPKYTELPNTGHRAWDPAYRTPELYEWLFGQVKK